MRKILRFLLVAFLIVAAFIFYNVVVVPHYGADTAIYECSGTMTKAPDKSGPITLFIKITQNRWWRFGEPLDGWLRLEFQSGSVPTTPDVIDPINADRLFKHGSDSLSSGRPFPGLFRADAREDLFVIKRVDTFLNLYRRPKKGETADLTGPSHGQFSTISNSLRFKLSDETAFNGACTPKNK
jgi:hypothetical protein